MALQDELDTALAKAVRIAGSQVAFGKLIGRRQSVVQDWLRFDRLLPLELVLTVEAATGVSRHELRPDLANLLGQAAGTPNDQATGTGPAAPPSAPPSSLADGGPVSPAADVAA